MNLTFYRRLRPLALVAGLILTAGVFGQAPHASVQPRKCLLWKAVSGDNVVYLLGSIHLGSKKMYPLAKPIEDAFARAKVLVVEVDISKVDMTEAMTFIHEKGMYSDDDTLWKHISPETADKVRKFCTKYDMDASMFGMFKPWVAAVELEALPMQKAGMNLNLGIDKYFLDRAPSSKPPKRIEQLETAEFQLNLLSSMPESLSDEFLSNSLGESSQAVKDDTKLEKLWIDGDAEALNAALPKSPPHLAKIMRALREDRNPHMADVAEKYLKSGGPCFFVVGAAHLIGDEGVIALLKKRGYSVFQVPATAP